jgi:hypothetical protein
MPSICLLYLPKQNKSLNQFKTKDLAVSPQACRLARERKFPKFKAALFKNYLPGALQRLIS